jgi:hypothetical protein
MQLPVPANVHRCALRLARIKISIYAPSAKERFETVREHSVLHPERIVGQPYARVIFKSQSVPVSLRTLLRSTCAGLFDVLGDGNGNPQQCPSLT